VGGGRRGPEGGAMGIGLRVAGRDSLEAQGSGFPGHPTSHVRIIKTLP
jgi:hypothetical protein